MSPLPADPYKALGVGSDADLTAIKTAYRKLVLKCHPDKVQDPALKAVKQDEFQRVQQAYEILSDDKKRKEYDEDAKLKKFRDDLSRNAARPTTTPRASPKTRSDPHIWTAEPPSSFKPGPPPSSPYSPYDSHSHPFSHSWERDIPFRTSAPYDGHQARRTASYEKPRGEKEERRRRKDDAEPTIFEWARDKERERERDRDSERVREREKDRSRKSRSDREKEDKKDKIKREMEKREKERDRARRQDQQEKFRARKPVYVEPHPGSDGENPPSDGKHNDNARSHKSSRRDKSPHADFSTDKTTSDKMRYATDYMSMKRESKSATSNPPVDFVYNLDHDQTWQPEGDSPRPRRPSQDKKSRSRVIIDGIGLQDYKASPEFRAPRLEKSNTSPAGALYMSSSSGHRVPILSRASTMDYTRIPPPAAPIVPLPESGRHSSKSDQRRRGSFDGYIEEYGSRRSSVQPRGTHVLSDDFFTLPRTQKMPHSRAPDDVHGHPSFPSETHRKSAFNKVKYSPASFSPEHVYQTKRFSDDDISYSNIQHSSGQYSSPQTPYLHARS